MTSKPTGRQQFPLFQTPIDLAHDYWKRLLKMGDTVVDATCGNGHDTAMLASILESVGGGTIAAIDLQESAVNETKQRCASLNVPSHVDCHFYTQSHVEFPSQILPGTVALIVYNLGYLPGGDKSITTLTSSTLKSLENALPLIKSGGVISMTCYPGHAEGKNEEKQILEFVENLPPEHWSCCYHRWLNRRQAPSLLLIQKGIN